MYDHNSLNKVLIIGRLGNDPDVTMAGNSKVAKLSVATNERWRDRDGNNQERTQWHKIVVWGRSADFCENYLRKGSRVFVEGRLQTRDYEKDGQKRYITEIKAMNIQPLDGRNESQGGNNDYGYTSNPSGGYGGGNRGGGGGYNQGGGNRGGYNQGGGGNSNYAPPRGGGNQGGGGNSYNDMPPPPDDDEIPF